ncbi:MAG: glycosyltransferase family 2 protein [Clostridiales bacterium]|nr:glycosyltransferase family 2 protein [Clostridiales bacterium]
MKEIVIIPAYNEETTIGTVIHEIKKHRDIAILVVNDGSEDRTAEYAKREGAMVITMLKNKGIGTAMKAGYQFALEHDFDIAVQVDADGQHDISKLSDLISKIEDEKYDMAIGSRYIVKTNYRASVFRYIGIKYCSLLIRSLYNITINDPTSGYRAINKEVMKIFASNYLSDYPEVPSLSNLLVNNYSVCEIPVEMRQRQGGKSSISAFDSIIYFYKITGACFNNYFRNKKHKIAR